MWIVLILINNRALWVMAVIFIVVRTIALFTNRRSDESFVCDVSFSDVTLQSKRGVPLFTQLVVKSTPYWKGKVLPLLS